MISVNERILIRSERLREARLAAGLRLANAVGGMMSVPTLSRLEAAGRKHVPFSVVAALVRHLGIPLPADVSPQTWARSVIDQGIAFLERGRFGAALRTFRLRDLLVEPAEQAAEAEARVLEEWASWHCGSAWGAERMRDLGVSARDSGVIRAWIWAGLCEGIVCDRVGNPERAEAVVANVARVAEWDGGPVDILCARAAWGRLLARLGKADFGLEVVNASAALWDRGTLYGQARLLHARGMLHACAAQMEEARDALRASAEAAMEIQNPLLAAYAEHALADLYEADGEIEAADAAAMRAVAWYLEEGMKREALGVLSNALKRHVYIPMTVLETLPLRAIAVEQGGCRVRR